MVAGPVNPLETLVVQGLLSSGKCPNEKVTGTYMLQTGTVGGKMYVTHRLQKVTIIVQVPAVGTGARGVYKTIALTITGIGCGKRVLHLDLCTCAGQRR